MLKDREKWEKKIGFAPTMAHLHEGHLSLYKAAKKKTTRLFFHFVNPTQFNNPDDFQK